jgi:protein tyrosine phosphatase
MGPYADALLPLRSVEYINASPIDNLGEGAMPFIATMCPKRETFAHFWSMVWELGSRVIINLTHERDRVGSGPSDKRERYWPPLEDVSERQMSRWPVRPYTIGTEACEQVPALLRYTIELRGPLKSGDKPADAAAAAAAESQRPRRIVYL